MLTTKVSKIIRGFHDQFGGAIPVEDVVEQGKENGMDEDDIHQALAKLQRDGVITRIDDDTIEFM